ncbi:hypothetical protein MAP00_000774 [Monascus purpureus]|nr:hypothetical protein MAP00_000774 [Monascus purpureus]
MCASRSLDLEPLAVDTSAVAASTKTGIVAIAAECTQDQDQLSTTPTAFTKTRSHRNSGALRRTDFDSTSQSPKRQNTTTTSPMTLTGGAAGYSSSPEPPALFVRAMYDYHTDDYTSLSFRQGDVIQVLNQLETGWWDGVIDNVRGWFPSNYCTVITDPDDLGDRFSHTHEDSEASTESGVEEDYEDEHPGDVLFPDGNPRHSQATISVDGPESNREQEEAAFWIPQATPDGRLFYFNTLTGSSTMELPFENANPSTKDTGPRERNNFFIPDHTRPPPELMARGFERDEDEYDGSASEAEGESLILTSQDSLSQRRQSFIDSVSPATSMDSLNPPSAKSVCELKGIQQPTKNAQMSSGMTAANNTAFLSDSYSKPIFSAAAPQHFVDEDTSTPLTWAMLIDNMRYSIEAYRQTLRSGDRSEYVRKAEDISDHLRMVLAAGSDTTDNHSGNPSIISSNKSLYPHFRDMMSKFSKLVLWSHIASGDWAALDSIHKCIQEADRVMQSVYSYVDVAKQQRGESIRRVTPGFVIGSSSGGNWQDNGVSLNQSGPATFLDQDAGESKPEPVVPLDSAFLDQLDVLRRSLVGNVRRLEERLTIKQKIVTAAEHEEIANSVGTAAIGVVEQFRPWSAAVESVNLAPLGTSFQNPQLVDFSMQKQRAYDAIADFVLSCQALSAPLSDEWAELRNDSLEDRLNAVRATTRQLDNYVSQIGFSLSLLLEQLPESISAFESESRLDEKHEPSNPSGRGESDVPAGTIGIPSSYPVDNETDVQKVRRKNMDKAERFFGQAPPPTIDREAIQPILKEPEETPWYLKIDHEGEVFYDMKGNIPLLKCGTLAGLVEHLTRHDRLDTSFNNTFLITYRSFTSAPELFEMLVQRFNIQPPMGLTPDEMQTWTDRKQKPIRFRVVNILKNWFEHHWMEPNDEASKEILRRAHAFTENFIATTKTPGSSQLLTVIEQRLRGQDNTSKRLVPTPNATAPPPIIPKNMKKLKFLDIDPLEFARQLTIIESRLYSKIRPVECLNKTWQKKIPTGDPEPAANVKSLILHSNQLTNWVAEMILTQSDVKKRVVVIKHFVNVADKCRAFNNYSTMTSIISALGTAPIHRLNRTWAHVSGRTLTILEQMRKLMASTKNFGEYREALHLANPPCIPFFGVYLTDLTFIEDGIPSLTPSELINFSKRAKTAEVIRDIQQYQNVPYLLQSVPELQDYILNNLQSANDVHDMYDRSLEVEPREREEEKIARLLSESGFL